MVHGNKGLKTDSEVNKGQLVAKWQLIDGVLQMRWSLASETTSTPGEVIPLKSIDCTESADAKKIG